MTQINPRHYAHPSGVECIQVVEWFTANVGQAIQYLWRHEKKGAPIVDLTKAAWFAAREARRLAVRPEDKVLAARLLSELAGTILVWASDLEGALPAPQVTDPTEELVRRAVEDGRGITVDLVAPKRRRPR